MTPRTGGCRCGAIRYQVTAPALFHIACHCRDCQYAAGGSPNLTMVFPRAAFALTQGQPRVYKATAVSGGSAFCETCGVQLFSQPDSNPDIIAVKVGGLDDRDDFQVQADLWMASAPPWHRAHEGAVRFEGNAPG